MRRMVIVSLAVATAVLASSIAYSQPTDAVARVRSCSLKEGYTIQDAVRMSRGLPRDESSATGVFIREPVVVSSAFTDNADLLLVQFYPSYAEFLTRMEGRRTGWDRSLPGLRPSDVMTCDPSGGTVRQVTMFRDDAFEGVPDETLMTIRFCDLEEGRTVDDARDVLAGIADNFAARDQHALLQLWTTQLGLDPSFRQQNRRVQVVAVASSVEAMGDRLDLSRTDFNALAGLPTVMSCTPRDLWRTYRTHGGNN